jgi:hypothetical protein
MKLTTHLHLEPSLKVEKWVKLQLRPLICLHGMQRDTYGLNFYRQKYIKSSTLAASLFPCWPLNINTNIPRIAIVTGDQMHLSYNPNLGPFSLEYTVQSVL